MVVVSAVVNVAHTASHAGQHLMSLPGWQLAYIAIVIYAAPVVAASLLWTRYRLAGAWLLAASMAGSFAFGLLYHFVIPGPDSVFTQPPGTWRTAFGVSAALLLPLQGAGCLVGLWVARVPAQSDSRKPGTLPLIGRRKHGRPGVCPGSPGRKGEGVTARGLVWMGVPTADFGGTVAFFRDVMGLETFYGAESVAVHRRHERGARSHQDSWYMLAGDSEEGRIPRMEVHE